MRHKVYKLDMRGFKEEDSRLRHRSQEVYRIQRIKLYPGISVNLAREFIDHPLSRIQWESPYLKASSPRQVSQTIALYPESIYPNHAPLPFAFLLEKGTFNDDFYKLPGYQLGWSDLEGIGAVGDPSRGAFSERPDKCPIMRGLKEIGLPHTPPKKQAHDYPTRPEL